MKKSTIRLWVLEDNETYRRNLLRILSLNPDIDCAGDFADCETALDALNEGTPPPQVILLDLGLPGMGGLNGIPRLRTAAPECDIIVLTVFDDKPKVFEALAAGASGYLLKTARPDEVAQAVQDVVNGGSPLTPQIARYVLKSFNEKKKPAPDETALSTREQEILIAFSEGLVRKEVAEQLDISIHTIDFHVRNIYKKLHVTTITGAVGKALRDGLV